MTENILQMHSLASGYQEINLRTPELPVSRYSKKIEYFLDISPGDTVVDFGCGDGVVTLILAKAYPRSNFIGLDYSADLIEYSKKNSGWDNIQYLVANMDNGKLPIPDGSADKIMSWGVLQYIHPKTKYDIYQSEFLRILKRPGRICHFQIPRRFGNFSSKIEIEASGVPHWLADLKQTLKDMVSDKHGENAYKYSKGDLLRLSAHFSSIQILPDDFFKNRFSVVYYRK